MHTNHRELLVATTNPGKLVELNGLLSGLPIRLLSLSLLGDNDDIAETGSTFADNAALKATGYARRHGLLTLADDSGLEVEELGGRPGVHTARYAGAATGFTEKMRLLLAELENTGKTNRAARFVCNAAIAGPDGKIVFSAEGVCSGRIAAEARGTLGFGFDPVFVPEGYDRTFGELSVDIKQKISHRSRAFEQIIPFLRDFIEVLT
jgi:XTP/dITP diphosphohydrolase